MVDERGGRSTSLDDLVGATTGSGGRGSGVLVAGNVQDVELAACSGFHGVVLGGIMGDLVTVHDVLLSKRIRICLNGGGGGGVLSGNIIKSHSRSTSIDHPA